MSVKEKPRKKILRKRFRFLLEVIIVFVGIFIFSLIPTLLLPNIISEDCVFFGPMYFLFRAIGIFLAVPIFLLLTNFILEWQKKEIILEKDINPGKSHLKLYRISASNFKYQLLYGILILFIMFIPLDFLIYLLLPGTIDYTINSLTYNNSANNYLLSNDYFIFLISVLIIQISVGIYEETLARGFITKRGSDFFQKNSAVIISSLFFGLGHFAYFFNPISANYPVWYPLVWFSQTFFVGIILALFILRKKWIFPLIFAHAFNNVISAHVLWNYPNNFIPFSFYLYIPLLIISLCLSIWQYPRIKSAVIKGFQEFSRYFKNNSKIGEKTSDKYLRIIIDILIGSIIFIVGYFII